MKKTNTQPLKNVIREYIDALQMASKLKEVRLLSAWERVVGVTINASTKDIYIKDRKLYVYLNSSVIRNELAYIKDELTKRLNEEVSYSVIDDIVLK